MADSINGISVPFLPIGGVDGLREKLPVEVPQERSFETVFQKELKELKFSKHAQQRMESRSIQLSEQDLQILNSAVEKADEKGASESLVLLRDLAFVVSIKNRIVVTAMDGDRMKANVFTNIDSAIIAG
jgi:flagellar operon protein